MVLYRQIKKTTNQLIIEELTMKRTQLTENSVRFQDDSTQTIVTPHKNTTYKYNEAGEPVSMHRIEKYDDGGKIIEVYGSGFKMLSRTVIAPDHVTTYRYENDEPVIMLSARKNKKRLVITKF